MFDRSRFVPLIVACPMFLQNIDLFATTVALPDIAESLQVPVLHLSMVIAAYAISVAAFLPLSAWLSDRFGAKRMFCIAVALFSFASALCGMATTANMLVFCRVLQGFGAAMMIPVGRLILLRSVPPSELVVAMAWFIIPPTIGRLIGPLFGGLVVTLVSWHWIFFVNVPLGIMTLCLAMVFLKDTERPKALAPFDFLGFLLMSTGLGATLGGLQTLGKIGVEQWLSVFITSLGVVMLVTYGLYSRKKTNPVIDLRILSYRTFRTTILGAVPFRLANAAVPFLLPLMLQLVVGLSALMSGLMVAGAALGTISTRFFMRRLMAKLSFKHLFLLMTLLSALAFSSYGVLADHLSSWMFFGLVFLGGLFSSVCLVTLNTLGFVDVPEEKTSHATAMLAMTQQSTSAMGVVMAATMIGWFAVWRGGDGAALEMSDFIATFIAVGLICAISMVPFSKLEADVGKQLR